MATTNLGRVQGAGFFYTTASSGTSVALSTITPKNIKPLAGDCVIFPNGDVRKVTSVSSTTVTCGSVVASFKGEQGPQGPKGPAGELGDWSAEKMTVKPIFNKGDGTYLYHLKQIDNFYGSNTDAIGTIEIKDGKGTSTCVTNVYYLPSGNISAYKAGIRYDTIVVDDSSGNGYIQTIYSYYMPLKFNQSTGVVSGYDTPKLAEQNSFGEAYSTIKVLKIA